MGNIQRLFHEFRALHSLLGWRKFARYLLSVARHAPQIFQAKTLRPADRFMESTVVKVTVSGVTLRIKGADFSGARELYGRQVYFANGFFIKRGCKVVDLGANVGLFSLLAAKLGAVVISVEAQNGFISEITGNLQRNGCFANIHWGMVGSGGLLVDSTVTHTAMTELPPSLDMDALIPTSVDFLKCDIEGSEFALFQSAGTWLNKVIRIAMEVHLDYGDPLELQRSLQMRGFAVKLMNNQLKPVTVIQERSGYLFADRPD
jgi:FkbM family methyltransferase